jgi:RNA methyltransferase, TrmH family
MEPRGALGARNHRIRRLRRLVTSRRDRAREGVIVLEGPTLAAELLGSGGGALEAFVEVGYTPPVLDALRDAAVPVHLVEPGVLAEALSTTTPQPLAVVARAPEAPPLAPPAGRPLLVVVELRDPGNAGTLLRTAEAAGCVGLLLAGGSVDPDAPKVLRAAAGARLRLPVWRRADPARALGELADLGWVTHATVVDPEADPYDLAALDQAAIVLGNEAHGLAPEVVGACRHRVTIPLDGPTESLNVAAAGAVLCFEALRQRRRHTIDNPLDILTPRGQR